MKLQWVRALACTVLRVLACTLACTASGAFAQGPRIPDRLWTEQPASTGINADTPVTMGAFSKLAKLISPAVVNISVTSRPGGADSGDSPYGRPMMHGEGTGFFIHADGYASKCTFCIHRVEKGQNPACVSVCPTRCMHFGDADDPLSEVSRLLASRPNHTLLPEAGTKPRIYYLT